MMPERFIYSFLVTRQHHRWSKPKSLRNPHIRGKQQAQNLKILRILETESKPV